MRKLAVNVENIKVECVEMIRMERKETERREKTWRLEVEKEMVSCVIRKKNQKINKINLNCFIYI